MSPVVTRPHGRDCPWACQTSCVNKNILVWHWPDCDHSRRHASSTPQIAPHSGDIWMNAAPAVQICCARQHAIQHGTKRRYTYGSSPVPPCADTMTAPEKISYFGAGARRLASPSQAPATPCTPAAAACCATYSRNCSCVCCSGAFTCCAVVLASSASSHSCGGQHSRQVLRYCRQTVRAQRDCPGPVFPKRPSGRVACIPQTARALWLRILVMRPVICSQSYHADQALPAGALSPFAAYSGRHCHLGP